ncbi:MAG TPA: carboxypeptidase-like regulatory domain-containing protein [Vicinamibacteria bacterium]|nr:carboxypeptidase-like regulatory domain-containing protein [Vicinamibacteria bacterium]
MRQAAMAAVLALATLGTACRVGKPVMSRTPENETTPGTIAGILSTGADPVAGRRVTAVALVGEGRYSAVTNVTGGFSIPVPPGKYRLEVELREGEAVVRSPGTIDINESDLDANLEVVIGGSS